MTPGSCEYEISNLDGKKVYCGLWECWTNCREMGYCIYEDVKGKKDERNEQLTLF